MSDVAVALRERGIALKAYTIGQHRGLCPQCSHTRKKKNDPCLSVRIDEDGAAWSCFNCSWADGFKLRADRRVIAPPRRKVYRKPPPPKREDGEAEMLQWFAARGISEDTVRAFGIHMSRAWFPQVEGERRCVAFPYRWDGHLRNVKYRATRLNDDGTRDKMFAQEKDAERTLFNADEIQDDEMVIVEGEMDVLACWEAGLRSVVSLPDGAGKDVEANSTRRLTALDAHADKLASVKRVIIATDGDGPGSALADALALRFGIDRCSRVHFPEGTKDANEVLQRDGAEALVRIIRDAAPWPIEGVDSVRTFANGLEAEYEGKSERPLSTCIPAVDKYFRIVPGAFVVVSGIPGHGKSSFVDQLVVNLGDRYGWRTAIFSPEHSPVQQLARMIEKKVRKPFYEGVTPRMSKEEMEEGLDWLAERVMLVQSREASPTLDWLLERFRAAAIRMGINAIVIDPWNEVEASRPRDMTETEFIGQAIQKLKRFARAHRVTVFCVVHPSKMERGKDGLDPVPSLYDLAGSAHWRNKADAGLIVHRHHASSASNGEDRTEVIVRKIRNQPIHGEIGSALIRFNLRTRCFEDPDPENAARAANEF